MTFGEKLSSLRKQANMSQTELAEKLGVSRQVVSKWEKGKDLPDIDNVKKVSSIFGKTIDEMLDYKVETVKLEYETTKEEIEKKDSKLKNVNNFVLDRFSDANRIYILSRELKMNAWQWILDFFIGAGTLEMADILKTGIVYSYLVEMEKGNYLVLIQKTTLLSKKLKNINTKRFVIDGYKYTKNEKSRIK